jgi:hypothetical protein
VLNFIAYLETAQDFHRYLVKNQLIADKIRIHTLPYLIASSLTALFQSKLFTNPLNTLATVVRQLKLEIPPFCPQSTLPFCIMYGCENKQTFPYAAFTVGLPDEENMFVCEEGNKVSYKPT